MAPHNRRVRRHRERNLLRRAGGEAYSTPRAAITTNSHANDATHHRPTRNATVRRRLFQRPSLHCKKRRDAREPNAGIIQGNLLTAFYRTWQQIVSFCREIAAVTTNQIHTTRVSAQGTATLPPQEASMGTVMIRCPETGREISTGFEADPAHFKSTPVFFARSYCPICRTEHEWFAQEAWVCEPGEPAARKKLLS